MTLFKCRECGNEVSDQAISCPKCENPVQSKKTKFWFYKLYFFLYLAFCLYCLISRIDSGLPSTVPGCLGWVIAQCINFVAAVGLYLYAYEKKWLPSLFWKTFTPLCYIAEFIGFLNSDHLATMVMSMLLLLPLFIALFQYSYGKKELHLESSRI